MPFGPVNPRRRRRSIDATLDPPVRASSGTTHVPSTGHRACCRHRTRGAAHRLQREEGRRTRRRTDDVRRIGQLGARAVRHRDAGAVRRARPRDLHRDRRPQRRPDRHRAVHAVPRPRARRRYHRVEVVRHRVAHDHLRQQPSACVPSSATSSCPTPRTRSSSSSTRTPS